MASTAPGGSRPLTPGEIGLAKSVFGTAINLEGVEVRRRKWAFFQSRDYVMAPRGHLHFHPRSAGWREDFSSCPLPEQAFLLHELCHVWQHQRGIFLPLARHPFCRYRYRLVPGRPLARYGIEQQAEIVRHAFLLRHGVTLPGRPPRAVYDALLAGAFGGSATQSRRSARPASPNSKAASR